MAAASQITATVIFIGMFTTIISGRLERHIPALVSAGFVVVIVLGLLMRSPQAVLEVLNLTSIFDSEFWYTSGNVTESAMGINWETIFFFVGMMIMVEGMWISGFFRWLCLNLAKAVNYKIIPLFFTFIFLAGFMAMFVDSITVIMFLAAITVELSKMLKFDPKKMIIAEIFCANLGGAATMCGDPPNIIIGTSLHLTFTDFMVNTGVIVWLGMIPVMLFFYLCFRKSFKESESLRDKNIVYPKASESVKNYRKLVVSMGIFTIIVVLLITHAQTGLTVSTIGVVAAILTMLTSFKEISHILKRVDWKTVIFFIGLFVVVGGLEQTKILELMANAIGEISGGNITIMVLVILWVSAIASAIVDNIPFAATMVPIIKTLSITQGVDIQILAWTLALGTDIGGNATPVGASANVVGTSIAENEGHKISWGEYCKYSLPATILVLLICTIYLVVRYM